MNDFVPFLDAPLSLVVLTIKGVIKKFIDIKWSSLVEHPKTQQNRSVFGRSENETSKSPNFDARRNFLVFGRLLYFDFVLDFHKLSKKLKSFSKATGPILEIIIL